MGVESIDLSDNSFWIWNWNNKRDDIIKNIKDCKIGKGTVVQDNVDLYKCVIGENCKIGSYVYIEENVVIGSNVKIKPFVFIPTGVKIGNNVFIGPSTTFINDKYPRAVNPNGTQRTGKDWKLIKTIVED
ncbi:unnamed protein product, partial [marine sediment metagenome]